MVYAFSRSDIADPDLWWHMRNAQYLLTQGHLPVVDVYSFTAPGAPVLPFEYLAEIPYYLAYKCAGFPAVFLLIFLLCTAIVLGIFRLAYLASDDLKNSFLVALGGGMLASVSFGARTLLFGWLYLVILLLILEAARRGDWKWLWLVPPLFCLWVNTHGSWPMGLVVFGIFIASGLVEGSWGHAYANRWPGPQLRKLLITFGASVAAVFVNPFGYRLVAFPFQVMFGPGSAAGFDKIQEFSSVNFHTHWGRVAMIMILGILLISIFSEERWRLDEVGFVMLALYFALNNVRFMFLAGILVPPIFAKRLKLMTPYDKKTENWRYNAVALAILLGAFIVSVPRHWNEAPIEYPERAVAYMKTNGIQGRLFHHRNWGGYLIWCAPELKVFVDTRGEPFDSMGVYKDYWAATSDLEPQAVLDKYSIEYVLMPPDTLLSSVLKTSPKWTVVYSDKVSLLFRRSPTI
jgi:hypothetical protein